MKLEHRDPADLPEASMRDDPVDHVLEAWCARCGHPVDAVCPECGGQVEASGAVKRGAQGAEFGAAERSVLSRGDFYRRFVSLVHNARNSKFMLGCYLMATGDGFADGVSMTEFGRVWGVKKATVSKQCRIICAYLGIAPSRYMRAEETAAKFRLSNRRPQKIQQEGTERTEKPQI